jgi:hypothetical protein
MAHLLELPNKINLSREDYLKVQQIYRGWALLGFVVVGAFLSTLALTITVRHERKAFILALIAFPCIAGTQVVFWTYTYPANQSSSPSCAKSGERYDQADEHVHVYVDDPKAHQSTPCIASESVRSIYCAGPT